MTIFHSYVSLTEGTALLIFPARTEGICQADTPKPGMNGNQAGRGTAGLKAERGVLPPVDGR